MKRRLLFPLAILAAALGLSACGGTARTADTHGPLMKAGAMGSMAAFAGGHLLMGVVVQPSKFIAWVPVSLATWRKTDPFTPLPVTSVRQREYAARVAALVRAYAAPHARAVVLDKTSAPGGMEEAAGALNYELLEVATGAVHNAVWVTVSRKVWENAYLGETYSAQRIAKQLFGEVTGSGSEHPATHVIVILPQL